MNVINRLIGNEEGAKAKIDGLLRQAKTDATLAKKLYEKSEEAFSIKYDSYETSSKHRRSAQQLDQIEKDIHSAEAQLVRVRTELNKKHMLKREQDNVAARLSKLSIYNKTGHAKLKEQRASYVQFELAQQSFDVYDRKFTDPPNKYTQEDYNSAIIQLDVYTRNKKLATELKVSYDAIAIATEISQVSSSILYSEQLTKASAYRKQSRKVHRLSKEIAANDLNMEPSAFIQQHEQALQYISHFEKRRHRARLEK